MKRRYFCATLAALLTILAASGASHAQDSFPSHPIRIVIPYSAGSVADVFGAHRRPEHGGAVERLDHQ